MTHLRNAAIARSSRRTAGRRRRIPTVLGAIGVGAIVVVAAVGCAGDDGGGDGDDGGGGTRGGDGIVFPDGADDVVLRLGDGPVPTLLIAGDGAVYQLASDDSTGEDLASDEPTGDRPASVAPAGFVAIAPAPPAPTPMVLRRLTDEGLQRVFERADELGLLEDPPEYADVNVTDSGSTDLTLRDSAGTYEHSAYALGYVDEEDADRQALLDMVEALGNLDRLAGRGNISEPEPYEPETYLVFSDTFFATGLDGQQWPAGLPLDEGCVALPLDRFPAGAAGTYEYTETGEPVRVWVVPDLPGDEC